MAASAQAPGDVELCEPVFTVHSELAEQPPVELRPSVAGFRAALDRLGFVEIQTPKIVASATEGGSNVFRIDYFERRLCEEHGAEFLFVTGYKMAKRPFSTHPEPGRPGYSNSFDLLFRGLELVNGGQRLHRYEDYEAVLHARGLSPEPYEGYLQAFRYGMPPHGGLALGLERWVARLAGAQNIRETTLFPRDRTRLAP